MGRYDLDNNEYDSWLAKHRKEQELMLRRAQRKAANKGYEGWHFGCGDKPFHAKDKEEFKQKLDERGLMMRDDVRKRLK